MTTTLALLATTLSCAVLDSPVPSSIPNGLYFGVFGHLYSWYWVYHVVWKGNVRSLSGVCHLSGGSASDSPVLMVIYFILFVSLWFILYYLELSGHLQNRVVTNPWHLLDLLSPLVEQRRTHLLESYPESYDPLQDVLDERWGTQQTLSTNLTMSCFATTRYLSVTMWKAFLQTFQLKNRFKFVKRDIVGKTLSERTQLDVPTIIQLLRFCLTSTAFQYRGQHYKQLDGVAMGSPVSPNIADIF